MSFSQSRRFNLTETYINTYKIEVLSDRGTMEPLTYRAHPFIPEREAKIIQPLFSPTYTNILAELDSLIIQCTYQRFPVL